MWNLQKSEQLESYNVIQQPQNNQRNFVDPTHNPENRIILFATWNLIYTVT